MDPLLIVGAASSIVSILDIATRYIGSLPELQRRRTEADWIVGLLVGQLATFKAVLEQIYEWIAPSLNAALQSRQLFMDFDTSLESCHLLISVIKSHVSSL